MASKRNIENFSIVTGAHPRDVLSFLHDNGHPNIIETQELSDEQIDIICKLSGGDSFRVFLSNKIVLNEKDIYFIENNHLENVFEKFSDKKLQLLIEYGALKKGKTILEIIKIKEVSNIRSRNQEVMVSDDFDQNRLQQCIYQIERNNCNSDFGKCVQQMAVAGEIAFEEICLSHKLDYKNTNCDGKYDSAIDCYVNGKEIDVKTRNDIGGSGKKAHLDSDFVGKDEIIAFLINSKGNTSNKMTTCNLVGIFDPVLAAPFQIDSNISNFYNPCCFVDFEKYFDGTKEDKYPLINEEAVNYYHEQNQLGKLINFYGPAQMLESLKSNGYLSDDQIIEIKEYEELIKNQSLLIPLKIYRTVIDSIKARKKIDCELYKDIIFPLAGIHEVQVAYLTILLDLAAFLPQFRCKFTGDGIEQCEIIEKYGIIFAKAKGTRLKNTLFAFDWYNGDNISLVTDNITICDLEDCACLVHTPKEKSHGRRNCKKNGEFPLAKYREKKSSTKKTG
jgi:hypothetical protein